MSLGGVFEQDSNVIAIPEISLIALIGATGSGKSAFAATHFAPDEILNPEQFISFDGATAPTDAYPRLDSLLDAARRRLSQKKLTVIDAVNVRRQDRAALIRVAEECGVDAMAIVFHLDESICLARQGQYSAKTFSPGAIHKQVAMLQQSLPGLEKEGFCATAVLNSPAEVESARVARSKRFCNLRWDRGPFDIIGDIHGCYDELLALLTLLGYHLNDEGGAWRPEGRKAIFLGDLVDRGPDTVQTVNLVMAMLQAETALCVPGNHDVKLARYLQGNTSHVSHNMQISLNQLQQLPENEQLRWTLQFCDFVAKTPYHYVLDEGNLVVAHAGLPQEMHGKNTKKAREFALYGDTTGETDEYGLPERLDWAANYSGAATVVYGHTPVLAACWLHNTINIDTGCVFGGRLTALRWPEKELLSVSSAKAYASSARFVAMQLLEQRADDASE